MENHINSQVKILNMKNNLVRIQIKTNSQAIILHMIKNLKMLKKKKRCKQKKNEYFTYNNLITPFNYYI